MATLGRAHPGKAEGNAQLPGQSALLTRDIVGRPEAFLRLDGGGGRRLLQQQFALKRRSSGRYQCSPFWSAHAIARSNLEPASSRRPSRARPSAR